MRRYKQQDNPLRNVKVERAEFCEYRNHLIELLIDGLCRKCLMTLPLPNDNTPVFKRLENIKKIGV